MQPVNLSALGATNLFGLAAVLLGVGLLAPSPAAAQTPGLVRLNEILANSVERTNTDGSVTDWIELHNPASVAVDLADASLTDNESLPRRFIFPSGSVVPGHGFRVIRCFPAAAGSITNTGFGLKQGGGSVSFFDTVANGGGRIDSVTFGPQAADWPIGRVPDGSGAWALVPPSPGASNTPALLGSPSSIRINEWMAKPRNGEDDFLELYNSDSRPVRLTGMFLTDDPAHPNRFQIGNLAFIGTGRSGGFALFIADSTPSLGPDHLSFGLRESGERVVLSDAGASVVHSIQFGPQSAGVSEGFLPDGSLNRAFFPDTPSPGAYNRLLSPITNIVINELLTHTDPPLQDAIEFRNTTDQPVDMGGWLLTLQPAGDVSFERTAVYRFPSPTVVPAEGFVVFYESQLNTNIEMRFNSAHGGRLVLNEVDANGELVGFLEQSFGPARNGVSFGWYPTSDGGHDFVALSRRTFGVDSPRSPADFARGRGLPNAEPLIGPVVLSEIQYHPPDIIVGGVTNNDQLGEYIELRNVSGQRVPLYDPAQPNNHWRLRDAVDFDFPARTTLAVGEIILVVPFDPVAQPDLLAGMRSRYGVPPGVRVFGPYSGELNNNSDSVELVRPDPPQSALHPDVGFIPFILVDKAKYTDAAPWPLEADGGGSSLQRRDANRYGNDPINWKAAAPTPGRPNALPPSITSLSGSRALVPGTLVVFSVTASGPGPLSYQWRHEGVDISGATDPALVLANVSLADSGAYRVRVRNEEGTIESEPLLLRADPTKPVITLVEPRTGTRGTNSSLLVRGTARDDLRLVGVGVSVNGGPFAGASLSNGGAWSFLAALVPGTNVILAKAVDSAGNDSAVAAARVVFVATSRISILSEHGQVTPHLDGSLLELGRGYTVKATPAAGYLFSHWTGPAIAVASPALSFLMESNLVLEAHFLANGFPALQGSYNGLFQEAPSRHESSGFITLKLAGSGTFSGTCQQGSRRAPFSGTFSPLGHFTNALTLGTNQLVLTLHLALDDPAAGLHGRIETAGWSADLLAFRAPFKAGSHPSPFAGAYTVILPGTNQQGGVFAGDGFASVRVDAGGMVSLAGSLADGSKVTYRMPLSEEGLWPVYLPLDGGGGSMIGWVTVSAPGSVLSGGEVTGSAGWFKPARADATLYPAGFVEQVEWTGALYRPPASGHPIWGGTNAVLAFSGGELDLAFTNRVAISLAGAVTDLDGHHLTLSFAPATGLFSGAVTVPGSVRVLRFGGALHASGNFAAGFFPGTHSSGRVYGVPSP